MTFARRQFMLLAACVAVTALAGCASGTTRPAAGGQPSAVTSQPASPASTPPQDVHVAAFNALAKQEATAWPQSPLGKVWKTGLVVLSVGDLSSGPSGGFPSNEDKEAFINGDLVFTGPSPSGGPAGVVAWPDGSTMKVPVLSEARVFSELTSSRQCPDCVTTPLAVTSAAPTTLKVATSRGIASVPAWAFALKGVSTPVIEAALAPGSYVTPSTYGAPAEKLGPLGTGFAGAVTVRVSTDGRTLTLGLAGTVCDTTRGGLVAEVGGAVVVGGWMHDPNPEQACTTQLVLRTATVRLAAPVGNRVILSAATGQPVTEEPLPKL